MKIKWRSHTTFVHQQYAVNSWSAQPRTINLLSMFFFKVSSQVTQHIPLQTSTLLSLLKSTILLQRVARDQSFVLRLWRLCNRKKGKSLNNVTLDASHAYTGRVKIRVTSRRFTCRNNTVFAWMRSAGMKMMWRWCCARTVETH